MKTGDDVQGEHQQDLDRKTNNNKDDLNISSDNNKKIDKKNEESEDNPITHDEVYKLIETKVDEVNKLMHENEALKKKNSLLKETIESYEESYNKLVSQNQLYENYIRKCESKIQELNKELKDSYKESKNNKEHAETFKTELIIIQKELDAKQENINELKKNNVALREEASKYQSALGVAANFRISDDKNHSVQLKNDILSLQDAIEDYVTNLKGNVEVNIENVEKLAQKYGCLTNIITEKTKRQNKSFIKAVLQRYVLEVIITNANDYFDYLENTGILHLESEILMKTNDLCLKLDKFSETRTGTDKITSTSSIKIRQEAYAALSNRGFSEIIENNKQIEHNFIYYVKHILNEYMNKYRIINDTAKKQSVENMATNIIREFIRLFWFRLNVQEPIVTIAWFEPSTKIDRGTMEGRWEEEYDDVDNLIVDLCYFPIIGLNLKDPSERKLYTRAKVFPRCQGRNYAISLFEKMVKNVTPSDKSESQQAGHGSNEASNHEDNYQNRK